MPPTLTQDDHDFSAKLRHEKNRFERPEPLQAVAESMRWTLRCMHVGCEWEPAGPYTDGEAARAYGQFHADSTGHPVKPRVTVEFDSGVIRAEGAVR